MGTSEEVRKCSCVAVAKGLPMHVMTQIQCCSKRLKKYIFIVQENVSFFFSRYDLGLDHSDPDMVSAPLQFFLIFLSLILVAKQEEGGEQGLPCGKQIMVNWGGGGEMRT